MSVSFALHAGKATTRRIDAPNAGLLQGRRVGRNGDKSRVGLNFEDLGS